MKVVVLYAALLAGFVASVSRAADTDATYTIRIHVASSELRNECTTSDRGSACTVHQVLAVIIDGKKYSLESVRPQRSILSTGDYQSRIVNDSSKGPSQYERRYELHFADGKAAQYEVVGESE